MNWNKEMITAYEAGCNNEACPNDFYGAYAQGVTTRIKTFPALCVVHEDCIQDFVRHDAVPMMTAYSQKELAQYLAEKPGAVLIAFDVACEMQHKADRNRYNAGRYKQITSERFQEMLEVLPPQKWTRTKDGECFALGEMLCGDLVSWFVKRGDKFFEVVESIGFKPQDIIECAQFA